MHMRRWLSTIAKRARRKLPLRLQATASPRREQAPQLPQVWHPGMPLGALHCGLNPSMQLSLHAHRLADSLSISIVWDDVLVTFGVGDCVTLITEAGVVAVAQQAQLVPLPVRLVALQAARYTGKSVNHHRGCDS